MPKVNRKLTETEIRNAKPQEKDYKLYDEGGLRLLVRPSGTKVWQYPYKFDGKHNIYTIGRVGEISSGDARRLRDDVRKMVREGFDPNSHKEKKKQDNISEHKNTFQAIAQEWCEKQSWAPKYGANIISRLEKDVFPIIGRKPIKKVNVHDILAILKKIESRGALDVAKRINQYCTNIFEFAIIQDLCDQNPAAGRSKYVKSYKRQHRPYLRAHQLPDFLKSVEAYEGKKPIVKLAMKLLMLTFVRPGELRGARWVEFDLEKAIWRIPAERMKMRREHVVPLSTQALEVLKEIHKISGDREVLFPGVVSYNKPISDVTLIKMIKLIGWHGQVVPHGMRATASTILNENGQFNRDAIERQLAHIEENKIRGAYHHTEYLEERKRMMQWWGDYLAQLA
ncbi:MAG: DUF4102 domain-containing protein [Proteobacteria bacterium]|nr:DUF4102 domain-containing protein [Pseudomonadota bacterium]